MELDQLTMFEWQRHSQNQSDVPHYAEILEFIDLRARASEMILHEGHKCHSQTIPFKTSTQTRTTYVIRIDTSCLVCRTSKHPLYAFGKFRSLSSEQWIDIVRKNQLCFNCSQIGHFKPQCTSDQKCQKCRRPHHTLLHAQFNHDTEAKANDGADRGGEHSLSAEVVDHPTRHNSHLSHPDPGISVVHF